MKMRFIKPLVAIIAAAMLGMSTAALAGGASPVGSWQTIDDVSKKPRSVVLISQDSQGQLIGKITKVYFRPGEGPNDVCKKCSGALKDQKVIGLTILTGMKQDAKDPSHWSGGHIVDPESGKSYKCTLTTTPNGNTLKVRGYIGISLIGRTQTWNKM